MHSNKVPQQHSASFRDPSGFVLSYDGVIYRQVNRRYAAQYDCLMNSGLYKELTTRGFMVSHEEVRDMPLSGDGYKIIRPERIHFISYPYEWSFSELQDAALLTLKVHAVALKHGMFLKDASAYNVQFQDGKPIFIDTLSFEVYEEGMPWVAYRQFCEHFLAPLALMSHTEVRLGQLLRVYPSGIPLDLTTKLLPWMSWFSPALFFHIHMHARSQKRYAEAKVEVGGAGKPGRAKKGFDRTAMENLIRSLRNGARSLDWTPAGTEWDEYYANTNYSATSADEKFEAVKRFIASAHPKTVWDIGANEGRYSRAASTQGIPTVAFDIDAASVEKAYRAVRQSGEKNLLPLILDITNPSPGLGWANVERDALATRGPADLVLALALIHHLAITNNVPFELVAEFLATIGKSLIIEFVPKEDSQVVRLLRNRADIFTDYTQKAFDQAFRERFTVRDTYRIPGSKRTLYYLERR